MENPDMWGYWRSDLGVVDALRERYPEMVLAEPRLAMALFQIEAAEALIDKIMEEKWREERDLR